MRRPHSSLGYQTPAAYVQQLATSAGSVPLRGTTPSEATPQTGLTECEFRMIDPADSGGADQAGTVLTSNWRGFGTPLAKK
jgi:hypothetical protein